MRRTEKHIGLALHLELRPVPRAIHATGEFVFGGVLSFSLWNERHFYEGGRGDTLKTELLRLNGAVERDPAVDAWFDERAGALGDVARRWFTVMRGCGDEVRELVHDGCPVACFGDVPFAYVHVFTSHVNVGFFQGAGLPDPARLLQGTGRFMRHVKLRPDTAVDSEALNRLIETAYAGMKARVEQG